MAAVRSQPNEEKNTPSDLINRRWRELCKMMGYDLESKCYLNDIGHIPYSENRDFIIQQLQQANISAEKIDAVITQFANTLKDPEFFPKGESWKNQQIILLHRIVEEYVIVGKELTLTEIKKMTEEVRTLPWMQAFSLTKINLIKNGLRFHHLVEFKAWEKPYNYGWALEALLNEKTGWFKTPEEALKYLSNCSKMEVYFIAEHGFSDRVSLPTPETTRKLLELAWFAPIYYSNLHCFARREKLDVPEFSNEWAMKVIQILQQLNPEDKREIESWCFACAYHADLYFNKSVIPTDVDRARRELAHAQVNNTKLTTTRINSHMYPPPHYCDMNFSPRFIKAKEEAGHVVLVGAIDHFKKRM